MCEYHNIEVQALVPPVICEVGMMPAALSCSAAAQNCSMVCGNSATPARSNSAVLYQIGTTPISKGTLLARPSRVAPATAPAT